MNRKSFIQKSLSASLLLGASQFPFEAFAAGEITKITLLHTNDQHSRIVPFPMDGSKNQGLGGMERRAALIEQIRAMEKHVLLLDSGDIFQGTPYFNKFIHLFIEFLQELIESFVVRFLLRKEVRYAQSRLNLE